MKIKINVQTACYDAGKLTIKLDGGVYGKSTVNSTFSELLAFASLASPEAVDFFMLSAAVYGIDRFIIRRPDSTDGWSREIEVVFPVSDVGFPKS